MYEAFAVRATTGEHDNRPIIVRILELRREKAALLGFANFADLVLEDRMAHYRRSRADLPRRPEVQDRAPLPRRESGTARIPPHPGRRRRRAELAPWDVAYYAEKQRAALYDFDEEALRPYFPMERVVAGLFELVHRLYGIRWKRRWACPPGTPSVHYYNVRDENGVFLGGFYADWYPRENKRGGAWMDGLITGGPVTDGFRPHLGLICGNLTPPVGGKPALLTHREVETIFHEFGHLLHHLLSRVEIRSLAGTNVAWDFVELPSQIMENWCWERAGAGSVRAPLRDRRADPRRPVPEDEARAHLPRRQRADAAAGLRLHRSAAARALRRGARRRPGGIYARGILQEFSPAPLPAEHAMIAAFTHLFASPVGYGAGYYSYKWAEVLEADAFTRFRDGGIFSREIGAAFRGKILSQGRQRRSGRVVPPLHGTRSGPERPAGAFRAGV